MRRFVDDHVKRCSGTLLTIFDIMIDSYNEQMGADDCLSTRLNGLYDGHGRKHWIMLFIVWCCFVELVSLMEEHTFWRRRKVLSAACPENRTALFPRAFFVRVRKQRKRWNSFPDAARSVRTTRVDGDALMSTYVSITLKFQFMNSMLNFSIVGFQYWFYICTYSWYRIFFVFDGVLGILLRFHWSWMTSPNISWRYSNLYTFGLESRECDFVITTRTSSPMSFVRPTSE